MEILKRREGMLFLPLPAVGFRSLAGLTEIGVMTERRKIGDVFLTELP
jgi:hypothetical protein